MVRKSIRRLKKVQRIYLTKKIEADLRREFNEGPFSILKRAVESEHYILVHCRCGKNLLGILKAFDAHQNLVMVDVTETWRDYPGRVRRTPEGEAKERKIDRLLLRGDDVILVVGDVMIAREETVQQAAAREETVQQAATQMMMEVA